VFQQREREIDFTGERVALAEEDDFAFKRATN
jgi:hypothetical protein